ncbi:glycosyltransferase family 9 protein [bacterium]|nr:glycosyltransferase family 9 protein [bacterium]
MKKVLVIRLTSLGDVIFTLPIVNSLKNSEEISSVGYLVAEKGLGVIKNNPAIDKVHFVPLKEWKKRPFSIKTFKEFLNIVKEIRAEKYDIALDCQQMFKNLLLFAFCGAKRRITFKDARELSILGGNEFIKPKAKFTDYHYHIVERNLDFARYLGIKTCLKFSLPPLSDAVKTRVDDLLKPIDIEKKTVVISPATTWKNKHWSEKNWAEVVKFLNDKVNLIFTGTNADVGLFDRILNSVGEEVKCINLMGKTDLNELQGVFSRVDLVLSPDSGSANLAWACQTCAVIAIFTCTPPKRFGPYDVGEGKYFSVSQETLSENCKLDCQPCFKKKCRLKNKFKNTCTNYPDSSKIITIINKILN